MTSIEVPDFFLASSEMERLAEPRRCERIRRVRSDGRDDLLLIRIDPPIIGQPYGLGGRDIDVVLVATRHVGSSLFPIRKWPAFVHVARLRIEDPADREHFRNDELESIAWAELYESEAAARAKRF